VIAILGDGTTRLLTLATNSSCQDGHWYVSARDSVGWVSSLDLCPSFCSQLKSDPGATLQVGYRCTEPDL
jgi:hypothetical protein